MTMTSFLRLLRPYPSSTVSQTLFSHSILNYIRQQRFQSTLGPIQYLPTFDKTSFPELDHLLDTIRDKILVIHHLNKPQLKLIQDPEQKFYLESGNVTVSIGDTDLRLVPYYPERDGARVHDTYAAALALSEKTGVWTIWRDILQGSWSAGVHVRRNFVTKLIKRALRNGQVDFVYDLLCQPWTRLSLKDIETRFRVVEMLRLEAEKTGWEHQATKKCLQRVEQLNRMARRDVHGGFSSGFPDPLLTLIPLEACAKLSVMKPESDTGSKLSMPEAEEDLALPRDYLESAATYAKQVESINLNQLCTEAFIDSSKKIYGKLDEIRYRALVLKSLADTNKAVPSLVPISLEKLQSDFKIRCNVLLKDIENANTTESLNQIAQVSVGNLILP